MGSSLPISEDLSGNTKPGLTDMRHLVQVWQGGSALNVVGDAAANGTLVLSIPVASSQTLVIYGLIWASKVNAKTLEIVHSNLATVGGAETLLAAFDMIAGGQQVISPRAPIVVYTNATAVGRCVNIYIPQTRAGAATNNAATEYVSVTVQGYIE